MSFTITPTTLLPLQVRVQKPLDVKTLFSAVDTGGTVQSYTIHANAGFGGSITDTTTNTTITAGQTLTNVAATDNFVYTASSTVGAESFTIQATDNNAATSNTATVTENVVANSAPTVMAVPLDPTTVTVNKTYNAAQLFQASDVNFDPIATYTFTTPANGSGVFTMNNGAHTADGNNATGALAANTTYTINASDLANLTFKTGSNPGSTSFSVAANDGLTTGPSLSITLNTRTNTTPTVTTMTPAKPIVIGGNLTNATNLFSATDLDGSPITGYSIQVSNSNNGFFTLDGTNPVALTNGAFFVSASDYATKLQYVSNATTAGTDTFTVTAIATPDASNPNNVIFSAATPLSVKVAASAPPVVTQATGASAVAAGSTVAASTLFTATDPLGVPIKGYSIIPSQAGQFVLNGTALTANQPNFVSTTDLPNLRYVAGGSPGTSSFQVAASDGTTLGNFATVNVTTVAASAPTVTLPGTIPTVEPNSPVAASTLFGGSETGGTINGFSIIVPSSIGHLTLNGNTLATDQPVFVSATDFANLKFVGTAAPGSANIQVAAFDGTSFSPYANVPLSLAGPTVTAASPAANSILTSTTYAYSKFFSVASVAGGGPVTGISIQTPPSTTGSFFDGTTQLAANQLVFVNAADLPNLTFQTSATPSSINFQVAAFDGVAFGKPSSVAFSSVANSRPTASAVSSNQQVTAGRSVLASSLISASDINGDAVTAYKITPGTGEAAGSFSGAGLTFTPGQATIVTAAQFATLLYRAGTPSLSISATGNVQLPGGNTGASTIGTGYTFTASDGSAYTGDLQLNFTSANSAQLQIVNLTQVGGAPAPTSATVTLGTVAFDNGSNATGFTAASPVAVSASNYFLLDNNSLGFSGLTDTAGATTSTASVSSVTTGQDSFTVQATDDPNASSFVGSTAATIKVNAVADQAPTTAAIPQTLPLLTNSQVAGNTLFSAYDPEGDAIKGYSIVAPPASVGTFSGFTSQANGVIYVSAADLANLRFTAGANAASGSFQVAAYDGTVWGAYSSVGVTVQAPQPATVTLTPPSVLRPNASIAGSSLFTAVDSRGATIQGYSITTPSGDNGYFTLNGVRLPDDTQNYVSAAQLSSLAFVGGAKTANATFTVTAYNGTGWANLQTETVNVAAYKAPVVNAVATPPSPIVGAGTNVSQLVSVATDPATSVQSYVVSAGSGSFKLNGSTVSATTPFTVSAADFANLQYIASATGNVTLNIAANDGTSTGAATSINLTAQANGGPTVTLLPTPQLLPGVAVPITQFFNATDNTGNAITSYVFQVNSGDGTLQLNGTPMTTTGPQTVQAADLSKVTYVPGNNITSITVSANDSIANGQPTTLVLSTNQSQSSIVVPANPMPSVAHNATIPVKQLLSGVAGTGQTLQGFNLSSDGGIFLLNNVALTPAQASLVSASDFANLVFQAPATAGIVHITSSAFDGTNFGPATTFALSIT